MTNNVVQFRDYQSKKDLARMYSEESLAEAQHDCARAGSWAEALKYQDARSALVQPFGVDYSAAEPYHAPDGDCA